MNNSSQNAYDAKEQIKEIIQTVEKIRLTAEPMLDAETDDKLSAICGKYCKNGNKCCFKEGAEPWICDNWKWIGEPDETDI